MMRGSIRSLYMVLSLQDQASAKLRRANVIMDETAKKMSKIHNLSIESSKAAAAAFTIPSGSIEQHKSYLNTLHHISATHYYLPQVLHKSVEGFHAIGSAISNTMKKMKSYAKSATEGIERLNKSLKEHRMSLMVLSAALSGFIGLTTRGAMNEEKYRRNIESLSAVIDYNHEGWQKINKALQEYIDNAANLDYISKENRARLVSEMITMGTAKDTILKYGPTLEKLGVSLGKSTDEVITAVRSSLAGFHIAFKRLGVMLKEEDIKKKMEEIRDAHKGWSEEALRAEAIMELAYPQMVARIGDFDKAMNSAYGDIVKFKEKLSDLSGDIGSIYIPYLRTAVEWMSRFIKFIKLIPY